MKHIHLSLGCVIIFLALPIWQKASAGLQTGLKIDQAGVLHNHLNSGCADQLEWFDETEFETAIEEKNVIVNLRSQASAADGNHGKAQWNEVIVEQIPASGQGLVDMIVGADGYTYLAYYDDGIPNYGAVYVRRSMDGGATWFRPDSGANGFALYNMFMDRPSIEVFETTPGHYRLAVAVSAPWPYQSSPNDIIVCWKDIGSGDDFTAISVQNDTYEDYVVPRLKAVSRPSQPTQKRILCASYGYSDGRLYCDYSDTNGTSWGSYSIINPATDQVEVWRPDFIEDRVNNRLFCVCSTAVAASPDRPAVLMALSTNQGGTWYPDLYRMNPALWNYCAESEAAIAGNASQPNRTLMIVWSGQETSGQLFNIHYTYQFLDRISVGPGSVWNPSPTGFPVTYGTLYSDTDYDNTMPAVIEDNRLAIGGYRVAFIDQHLPSLARVRYSECLFDTPVNWIPAEIISSASADPARQGSNALSIGVGYMTTTYPQRRCAVWPDFRDPEDYANNYGAYADMILPTSTPSPTATPTDTPTLTPLPSDTPTPIPTDTPDDTPSPTETPSPLPTSEPTNTPSMTPTAPPCLHHGNVIPDLLISSGDAQLAFYIAVDAYTPTYQEFCAADCDGDGDVTAGDAQTIFYYGLGAGPGCVDTPPEKTGA